MKSYPPPPEIVEHVYTALARRDIPRVLGLFSESIEILQSPELPWGGFYRGHDEAQEFFATLTRWISSAITIEHTIDAADRIVVFGRTRGKVNPTKESFDVPFAHVWTVRGGLVVRGEFYLDHPAMRHALPAKDLESVASNDAVLNATEIAESRVPAPLSRP